jgi:basic amino acid/polyamine antiporter, APA family
MESSSRPLSFVDATLLVMGGIIGVGIFFQPATVAQHLPAPGPFLGAWVLGAILALAGAMTFAELGAMMPRTGGWYVFLREGFGPLVAFCFAWVVLGVVATGACAAVASFFGYQVATLLEMSGSVLAFEGTSFAFTADTLFGLIAILVITTAALLGLKTAATLQALCMGAKLLVIGTFIVAGYALTLAPPIPSEALVDVPQDVDWVAGWSRAMLPVLFTFGGWQLLSYVAPSVKDAPRNLPRAIVIGVSAVAVVYLVFNFALLRVLGIEGLIESDSAMKDFAVQTLGDVGARVLGGAMALSAFGFLVATLITTPGVLVAMSREGLFPRAFSKLHPRTGAPTRVLLLQALVTVGYLVVYANDHEGRDLLADAVVFIEWVFHFLAAVALLRLARSNQDRPWRSPAYPLFPITYAVLAVYVFGSNLDSQPWEVTRIGLIPLGLGILTYFAWRQLGGRAENQ